MAILLIESLVGEHDYLNNFKRLYEFDRKALNRFKSEGANYIDEFGGFRVIAHSIRHRMVELNLLEHFRSHLEYRNLVWQKEYEDIKLCDIRGIRIYLPPEQLRKIPWINKFIPETYTEYGNFDHDKVNEMTSERLLRYVLLSGNRYPLIYI